MKTFEPISTYTDVCEGSNNVRSPVGWTHVSAERNATIFWLNTISLSELRLPKVRFAAWQEPRPPGAKAAVLPMWHRESQSHGECQFDINSELPKMTLDIFDRCKCHRGINLRFISQLRRGIGM
jgi:hypothetical protein